MKNLQFNPEILSAKPTHINMRTGELVKIFVKTKGFDSIITRDVSYTAEIMEGESLGKYTTVYEKDLKIYHENAN